MIASFTEKVNLMDQHKFACRFIEIFIVGHVPLGKRDKPEDFVSKASLG